MVAEIVTERMQRLEQEMERKLLEVPGRVVDPVLTKRDAAVRLRVSARTVDCWMKRGMITYMKIGRSVRVRWSRIEAQLARMEVCRWR